MLRGPKNVFLCLALLEQEEEKVSMVAAERYVHQTFALLSNT